MAMHSPAGARGRPMGTIAGAATESPAAAAAAALLASGEGSAHSSSASSLHTADKIKRIGDWIMGETLGQGSFGKVKLAHHAKTKEKVAIKIVDKSGIANVEDVERVYRETFILTTLKHTNIIKLFEVLDTPKSIMLVMEYAGGGELFSYVAAKHRLGEVESCRLFQQIISGVEYCHRAKIIHRDLKLENILLDKQGQVKIADFGLSNSIKFGQKMDTSCLTPDHSVLVRLRGWVPISQVRGGDFVWALQHLGSECAAWTRVVARTSRALRAGEALVRFQSSSTELLVTQDHAMWTKHPSSGSWSITPAAETETRRHVLLAAPPADQEDYPWQQRTQLAFLPVPLSREQDEAWCAFLGCFLGAGSLCHDDASTKTVLLRPHADGAVASLATMLSTLGWLFPSSAETIASRLSGNLMPCFTQRQSDGTFIAVHSELYDFLWPMIAPSKTHRVSVTDASVPDIAARLATEPVRMRRRAPAPALPFAAAAAATPAMPALFSAVAASARAVESARVAGTGRSAHTVLDPFAYRILAAASYAPVVNDSPVSLALHWSPDPPLALDDDPLHCKPATLSLLDSALSDAHVPLGSHVLISELVPITWDGGCDRELESLLCDSDSENRRDAATAALPPLYASLAQQSVQAVLACAPRVVVAFGRHAALYYNALPKAACASYIDGLRCYALSDCGTLVIEAPHPAERGPDTAQRVALALGLAQQFIDGAVLPAPEQLPGCCTAAPVDSGSNETAVPSSVLDEKPLDTERRSLFYSWRFYLGPRQSRAVLHGWTLGAGTHGQQKEGDPQMLQGFTSSRALVDDLSLLAARAGFPCIVEETDATAAAAPVFSVQFCRSLDSNPAVAMETPLSDGDAELVSKHSFTHVHCITTLAGNFLVRRDHASAAEAAEAAEDISRPPRPQSSVFIGNCGTPSYTCPEQINGKKYVGSSADIWSLGVILFAMISGFLPFEAAGIPALFKKIKNRQYKAPDYLSREAADLIERMLTLEPDKRASISEIRNHPWMLMEYTELAEIIEARKDVTPDMVAEARIQCMAVGDEQAQAAAAQASAHAANQAHAQARNKFAGHAKSGSIAMPAGTGVGTAAATGAMGMGALSKALVLPLASSDSSLPSGSPCASPTPNDDDNSAAGGTKSGSSSAEREGHHANAGAASSSGAAAAVRPRERGSILMQPASGPAHAKGFRDARNNVNATSNGDRYSPSTFGAPSAGAAGNGGSAAANAAAAAAKGRAMSIFDKLSVRTVGADGKSAEPHSGGSGAPSNGPLSAGSAATGPGARGVRFPPIGSPSLSPQFGEPAHAHAQPSSAKGGSRAVTSHGGARAGNDTLAAPSSAGGRNRRPSEFGSIAGGGGGAGLPSYMQPTENAQNHLLASEREEREKAEAADSTPGGGRGARRHGPISSPPPSGTVDRPSKARGGGAPVMSDRDRERERVDRERAALNELHEEFYNPPPGVERGTRDRDAPSAAAAAAMAAAQALREKKTPRARDGSIIATGAPSTTAGHIPAYMLETNSSRQRGGSKHTEL